MDDLEATLNRAISVIAATENDLIEFDARALGINETNANEYELVTHQREDGVLVYRAAS